MATDFKARLNDAFARMRQSGLFARQNWQCCQSCGYAAIKLAPAQVGYAFYHAQDATHVKDGHVYVAFSAKGDEAEKHVAVGQLVKSCAVLAGLAVEWDGDIGQRIKLMEKES